MSRRKARTTWSAWGGPSPARFSSAPATSPTRPAYGNLIALGVLTAAQSGGAPAEQIEAAAAYRDDIARTGRFLTYCGGAPIIGQRLRPDPAERVALKLVRESAAGIVISGRLGMHTSPAFAEDVYVGALSQDSSSAETGQFHRAGQCAGRHDLVPPARDPRRQPLRRPAFEPL